MEGGSRPWTPAEDEMIRRAPSVARLLVAMPHRTLAAIKSRKQKLKITWTERVKPLPGERWEKVPGWRLMLSTYGRSAQSDTGVIKRASQPTGRNHGKQPQFSAQRDNGRWSTLPLDVALHLTFGNLINRTFNRDWSEEEDEILRRSSSSRAASKRTGRSLKGCERRAERLGIKLPRNPHEPEATPKDMWGEAKAAVPTTIPEHTRQDLISEIMIKRLEGDDRPWTVLLKEAKTRHNKIMGTWKERSLDAPIAGHDDLSMLDLITNEHERF